jgi:hypothetical protein
MNLFNFILHDINIFILIAIFIVSMAIGAPRTVWEYGYESWNYKDESPAPIFFVLAVVAVLVIAFRMMTYTAPYLAENLFGITPEKNVLENSQKISTEKATEKVISVKKQNDLQQVETETGTMYEFSRDISTNEKYVFILKKNDSIFVCFTSEVNIDECKKAKKINS